MQPKQNKRKKASVDTSVTEVLGMNNDVVSLTIFLAIKKFPNNVGNKRIKLNLIINFANNKFMLFYITFMHTVSDFQVQDHLLQVV